MAGIIVDMLLSFFSPGEALMVLSAAKAQIKQK